MDLVRQDISKGFTGDNLYRMKTLSDSDFKRFRDFISISSGVTTDTRQVSKGKIFFALKGENFDGNEFAEQSIELGAVCAVIDRNSKFGKTVDGSDDKFIVVDDVLLSLQELSRWYRSKFSIPIIALTGTNGKTTTKELLNAVLSAKYRVTSTFGNLNNHIGVPLTLFNLNEGTQIAVIEMGASSQGEIELLTQIALPNYGLITNVGKAHLLGFGSFDGVKKAKGELYDYLQRTGDLAFYNVDNPFLCEMVEMRPDLRGIKYGMEYQGAEILPVDNENPMLRMRFNPKNIGFKGEDNGSMVVNSNLVGSYNGDNIIAALTIAAYFDVSADEAVKAIENYFPSNNRSQLMRSEKNVLVLDTYNANPTSMRASLENFEKTLFNNKVLILGDMRELGEESSSEHRDILKLVRGMSVERVYLVGSEFALFAKECSKDKNFFFYPDVDLFIGDIDKNKIVGKTVLIKGSNGIKLQKLIGIL